MIVVCVLTWIYFDLNIRTDTINTKNERRPVDEEFTWFNNRPRNVNSIRRQINNLANDYSAYSLQNFHFVSWILIGLDEEFIVNTILYQVEVYAN